MGRVIVISSGKGGVGKTTITANLGITLAKLNRTVCVVDADFGLNNLDVLLSLENRVVYDIMDVLKGNCRLAQGLIKDPVFSNLYLLASIKQDSTRLVSREDFKGIIMDLADVFDYVLIDAPAGIDYSFERAVSPAGEMLVVVTPSICSLRDARKTIDKVGALGDIKTNIVVNRAKWKLIESGESLGVKDIENLLGVPVVGLILENDLISLGKNLKSIFEADEEVVNSFLELAKNIENNTSNILDNKKRFGFLRGLKGFYKSRG